MTLKPHELEFFCGCLQPLVDNSPVMEMVKYTQHGRTSCLNHSLAVAYYSYALSLRLRLKCDYAALIRGALLHDFFLYDWHKKNIAKRLHGFRHPKIALCNAERYFNLSGIERDVILKHMWPLTLRLPRCREAAVVCLMDKFCTLAEIFNMGTGHRFYKRLPAFAGN